MTKDKLDQQNSRFSNWNSIELELDSIEFYIQQSLCTGKVDGIKKTQKKLATGSGLLLD